MIKTFEEWIDKVVLADELCANYYEKVTKAVSNKRLADLATDANGMTYLCEMEAKGLALPYEVITSRFGNFINGKYIAEHINETGGKYTSAIYCCYKGEIKGDITLLTLLGCDATIYVEENSIMQIYLDKNSKAKIVCPLNSKALVFYWGRKPICSGDVEIVKED